MATILREALIGQPAEHVWDVIRDFGAVHTRLAPGFVIGTRLEAGARTVTFANGLVVRELLVGVDEQARRLAYSVVGGSAVHHNASFQALDVDGRRTRLIWITDILPDDVAGSFIAMIDPGIQVIERTLNRGTSEPS